MSVPTFNLVINGIPCDELQTGWDAKFSLSKPSTATRELIVSWPNMADLVNYLLAANVVTVGSSVMTIGATHPIFPRLYVDDVQVTPYQGKSSGVSSFELAKLTVHYAALEFNPASPSVLRKDSMELASQVFTIPKESIKIGTGPSAKNAAVDETYVMQFIKYHVQLQRQSSVPIGAIVSCVNKCHVGGTFTVQCGSSSASWAGNQVIYAGPSAIDKTIMSNGSAYFDVTHTFLLSPISVNAIYDITSTAANFLDRFTEPPTKKYTGTNLAALGV